MVIDRDIGVDVGKEIAKGLLVVFLQKFDTIANSREGIISSSTGTKYTDQQVAAARTVIENRADEYLSMDLSVALEIIELMGENPKSTMSLAIGDHVPVVIKQDFLQLIKNIVKARQEHK